MLGPCAGACVICWGTCQYEKDDDKTHMTKGATYDEVKRCCLLANGDLDLRSDLLGRVVGSGEHGGRAEGGCRRGGGNRRLRRELNKKSVEVST